MRRSRFRVAFIAFTVGLLAVLSTGAPATADPVPGGKTGPPTPQVVPNGRACAEHSGSKSGDDEFVSCIGVKATLDRVPSVGETATLTYTVSTGVKLAPSDITVELPTQLAWAQAPTGFTAGHATSVQPQRSGTIATAQRRVQLVAGQPATFTGVVKAVAPGYGQIQVRAASPNGSNVDAGKDDVFLTVGDQGKPSRFGSVTTTGDLSVATLTTEPKGIAARPAWQDPKSLSAAGSPGLPPVTNNVGGTALACDSHVTGNWGYYDQAGVRHNSMNFQVQVRDVAHGTVSVGLTDSNGNFNLCFDSSVTKALSLAFVAENLQFRVQNGTDVFQWNTNVIINPAGTVNFGWKSPSNPADNGAVHAFDAANDTYLFVPKGAPSWCYDQKDTTCRQVRIDWNRDSVHKTEYNTTTNIVYLAADDPNGPIVVAHEIGHAVMDDVYNEAFPPHPGCAPHFIEAATNANCAWVEGFADWFAVSVYHTATFRWPSGASVNLEDPTEFTVDWGVGDITEGRVAGAMLDIADVANEGLLDRSNEGSDHLWFTLVHHIDVDFRSFWADRTQDGFNVANEGALGTLFQNTIDYGYRQPLTDRVRLSRPRPLPHSYSFTTSTPYWSVVAILPFTGTDDDLTLFDDRAETTFLSNSNLGSTATDFVAIDSNLRPYGDYYPKVDPFNGFGDYTVELVQGGGPVLVAGSPMTVNLPNDFVSVRDTYLNAGVPVTLTAAPQNSGQDVDFFLMGSDPTNPATFTPGRIAALASGIGGGPGASETLTYTPTRSGWYGVVINVRSAVGDITLTRS